ncbi:hypothetical protein D3C85_217560 [compost metagenome]|uniref:DUF4148 domain-containing protein n=1 Tax=Achromobacter sp. TaxID=134375 RepID=UPI000F9067D3
MKTVLSFRVFVPVVLAAAGLLSGPTFAQQAVAPATAVQTPDVPKSHDDVMRDLTAWREAGVEQKWEGDETPDIYSGAYVASYRKYVDTVHPAYATPPMQTPSQSQGKW